MSYEVLHKLFPERRQGVRENELFIFAGPCVVENESVTFRIAEELAHIRQACDIDIVFKASFVKANRTSRDSFTGLALDQALSILQAVKTRFGLKILSDVHEYTNLDEIADVVDVLQTPAFLVRQTEFLRRVAAAGKPINIKKGQFLSPTEMISAVDKILSFGNSDLLVCERGNSFGYNYLVNDFRGMQQLMHRAQPLVFDATHSVQRPGALGDSSGGDAKYAPGLAKAAVAAGVDGIFMETHPDPAAALSDGPNMIPLALVKRLLGELKELHQVVKGQSAYL